MGAFVTDRPLPTDELDESASSSHTKLGDSSTQAVGSAESPSLPHPPSTTQAVEPTQSSSLPHPPSTTQAVEPTQSSSLLHPPSTTQAVEPTQSSSLPLPPPATSTTQTVEPSHTTSTPHQQPGTSFLVSPEDIKPYPKAGPRKQINGGRKRGRCMIATDTPEKTQIEASQRVRTSMPTSRVKKSLFRNKSAPKKKQRRREPELSTESEDSFSSEGTSDDDFNPQSSEEDTSMNMMCLPVGSYAIARIYGKTASNSRHYIIRINEGAYGGYIVKFLKKHPQSTRFVMTDEEGFVLYDDIIQKLPFPSDERRERYKDMLLFKTDLSEFSLH